MIMNHIWSNNFSRIKFPLLNKINTGILKKRIMKLQKHKSVLVSKKANELFNNFLSKNRLVI
jgi:hypothetical protein